MLKNKHNMIAIILVLLFVTGVYYVGTDGFRAFTAESARTYALMENKPAFPEVTLQDSFGKTFTFDKFAKGKYVFLTFMYSSCTTVCPRLEMNMAKVYQSIPKKYIGKNILFLSISFDPTRDTPKVLDKYRTYFNSDGRTWKMARVPKKAELNELLNKLGIIVIPDGNGNFTHNTAFYLINRNGRLVDVMDFTKTKEASTKLITILKKEGE